MSDRLIIQSIDGGGFVKYLDLSETVHRDYAARCWADYELFVGTKDEGVHPAWNRLPLMLDAFKRGYRKVVWLDADTLVVRPGRDIFAETDDTTPLLMRNAGLQWRGEDSWNSGVIVANRCDATVEALEHVWAQRHAALLPHHAPSLYESNALLDWVFEHRETVGRLDERFNWQPFRDAAPREEAVVLAYHGMPWDERWRDFSAAYAEHYGA